MLTEYKSQIAIALVGFISALLSYYFGRKKTNAETDSIIANGAKTSINTMSEILNILKKDSEDQRLHRKSCEEEVSNLKSAVKVSQETIIELQKTIDGLQKELNKLKKVSNEK